MITIYIISIIESKIQKRAHSFENHLQQTANLL